MTVLLKGYLAENLGDDLFIKMLADRYNEEFVYYGEKDYPLFNHQKNITLKGNAASELLDKIARKLSDFPNYYEYLHRNANDVIVNIGGSIFIEDNNIGQWKKRIKIFEKTAKPYFILGANFGPYKNEEYVPLMEQGVFEKAADVCFRDKKSFNQFSQYPNVRCAPDIVYSLKTKDITLMTNKKAVISVINCEGRDIHAYQSSYQAKIKELVELFQMKGYEEITLMSFCQYEGDEVAINDIYNSLVNTQNVTKYFYKDNLDEALNVLGDSQVIVGSRFHANILGMVMDKTIIPIAYSDKTLNVLKDMGFEGRVYDIRDMENFVVSNLTDEELNYKIDITDYRQEAEKHFAKLDEVLEVK